MEETKTQFDLINNEENAPIRPPLRATRKSPFSGKFISEKEETAVEKRTD